MSLEYRSGHWNIIYYPAGKYSKSRISISPVVEDRLQAQSIHDQFIIRWKALPPKQREKYAKQSKHRAGPDYHIVVPAPHGLLWRAKMKDAPHFVLNNRMRASIIQALKRYGKNPKQGKNWEKAVGYTTEALRKHLERQFQPGMSWNNMGQWHIDHKIPVVVFNYDGMDDLDFKRCWALKNLRPMWALDNLKKHSTLVAPFQPSLSLTI